MGCYTRSFSFFYQLSFFIFSAVEEDQRSETPQPAEADIASNSGDSTPGSTRSSPLEKCIDESFTRAITPGQETFIKIQKGSSGLGLSIVGGSDSLLVSSVLIPVPVLFILSPSPPPQQQLLQGDKMLLGFIRTQIIIVGGSDSLCTFCPFRVSKPFVSSCFCHFMLMSLYVRVQLSYMKCMKMELLFKMVD